MQPSGSTLIALVPVVFYLMIGLQRTPNRAGPTTAIDQFFEALTFTILKPTRQRVRPQVEREGGSRRTRLAAVQAHRPAPREGASVVASSDEF
jgi:hypothetical protein